MASTYDIDPALRLVRTNVSGRVTSVELDELYGRMSGDPRFSPDYRQLADWRGVSSLDVTTAAVRDAAIQHPFRAGTRRAIVATSDVVFGVARVFATHAEGVGQLVEVFRTMGEAEAWLGLAP